MKGQTVDAALMTLAKKTTMAEIRPIDDSRSTARYRSEVAGNLVVEFLSRLNSQPAATALDVDNEVLARWNALPILTR